MQQIPKIIHYCWFGHNPLPTASKKYIQGWHKRCPDYKIVKWSENNFPVGKYSFTRKAYKYHDWAAVSDYARLLVLYKFGGIYLDIDVELLKPLDKLLNNKMFIGMENYGMKEYDEINNGLICGAIPKNDNILNFIKIYNKIGQSDDFSNHAYDEVHIVTSYFHRLGFQYKNKFQMVNGCSIYPTEYFAPVKLHKSFNTTNKTYSIHHYFGSWVSNKQKIHLVEGNIIRHIIGTKLFVYLYRKYIKIRDHY